MNNVVPLTTVSRQNGQGEEKLCLSRPQVDAPLLWHVFITSYNGNMDMHDMLHALDQRQFARKSHLSDSDQARARNGFRAVEKYGREHGQPCVPLTSKNYRGKTGIRLADLSSKSDSDVVFYLAKVRDQVHETHETARDHLAGAIGVMGYEVKLARQRDAKNDESAKAHAERMDQPDEKAA